MLYFWPNVLFNHSSDSSVFLSNDRTIFIVVDLCDDMYEASFVFGNVSIDFYYDGSICIDAQATAANYSTIDDNGSLSTGRYDSFTASLSGIPSGISVFTFRVNHNGNIEIHRNYQNESATVTCTSDAAKTSGIALDQDSGDNDASFASSPRGETPTNGFKQFGVGDIFIYDRYLDIEECATLEQALLEKFSLS
jgi:hypothetical protein